MTHILPYRKDILQSTGDPQGRCATMRVFHASGSNGTNHMELTSAQTKRLRAECHRLKLKPVVIVGQKGLGDNQHHEIDGALDHHELIKLRIPALEKDDKRELCAQICTRHNAQLVQSIGNVIVIYRCNPELDRFANIVGKATPSD